MHIMARRSVMATTCDESNGSKYEVAKVLTELLDELNIGEYEIDEKGLDTETVDNIGSVVKLRGHPLEFLQELKKEGSPFLTSDSSKQALNDLDKLFQALDSARCVHKVVFDLSLARGLDYYTGVIYEAVTKGATQACDNEIKKGVVTWKNKDAQIEKEVCETDVVDEIVRLINTPQSSLLIGYTMSQLVMLTWSYIMVVSHDPGSVPENWKPPSEENLEAGVSTSEDVPESIQALGYCRYCRNGKPPRCHHCSVFLNLAFALSLLCFIIMHASLLSTNTTSVEEKKGAMRWKYDLGRKKNFKPTLLSELSNEVGFPVTNMSFDALLESLLSTAKLFPQSARYRILAS
ncbi:hypothetical protein Tco_0115296 [Tanacetum coccineum]